MKIRTTFAFALAVASLTIGVPVAAADADSYQPQLKTVAQPDALDRYLSNNAPEQQPDALARYLRNNAPQMETTGSATHPDSRAARFSPPNYVVSSGGNDRDWTTGAVGALAGVLITILAIVGASAIRERRRLALR